MTLDLSMAGDMRGMSVSQSQGGTRSGLLWEVERILNELSTMRERESNCLPQILMCENVPEIVGTRNIEDFKKWRKALEKLGYSNYDTILNAKDFGIPQNRRRFFMISILGDYFYEFPYAIPLKYHLKNILQKNVDEKYFLSEKMIKYIVADNEKWTGNNGKSLVNRTIACTINTSEGSRRCDASNYIVPSLEGGDIDLKQLVNFPDKKIVTSKNGEQFITKGTKQLDETIEQNDIEDGSILDLYNRQVHNDVIQTIDTGYHNSMRVAVKDNGVTKIDLKRGYPCEVKDESTDTNEIDYIGNYSKSGYNQTSIVGKNGISPTVTENHGQVTAITTENESFLRIRKLTPTECLLLMGFEHKDAESMYKADLKDSNLYFCAGNSIVTTCLIGIFAQLFGINHQEVIEKYVEALVHEGGGRLYRSL